MDPFSTRSLGKCGVDLPLLGLGGAPLGDLYDTLDDKAAAATLDGAWQAGVRFYDTSPWYGRGQSEHRMGRALYRRPRDQFILSTKVGRVFRAPLDPPAFDTGFWAGGLHFEHVFDYSYDGVMRSYEDSLQRLGMNRIDLLLIHDLDIAHHQTDARVTAYLTEMANGGWRALEELRSAGLIGGIGAGINETGMIPRFLDLVDIDFFLVALPYTLMDQDALEVDFAQCAAREVGIVIGAVYASGILATGPTPDAYYRYQPATPHALDKAQHMEAVCKRHGVSLAAAAIQFPFGHPSVASVIPGAVSADQVRWNVENMRRDIPADLWAELRAEGLIHPNAPEPG